jgi:hypothetical protein
LDRLLVLALFLIFEVIFFLDLIVRALVVRDASILAEVGVFDAGFFIFLELFVQLFQI